MPCSFIYSSSIFLLSFSICCSAGSLPNPLKTSNSVSDSTFLVFNAFTVLSRSSIRRRCSLKGSIFSCSVSFYFSWSWYRRFSLIIYNCWFLFASVALKCSFNFWISKLTSCGVSSLKSSLTFGLDALWDLLFGD